MRRPYTNPMLECLTLQQLHCDKGLALAVINVVNRADIRMIERRGRLTFPLEAFERLMIFSERLGQELERDKTVQLGVLGLVDHTHAAAAKLFQNAVVRKSLSDHEGGPIVLANLRAEPETSQRAAGVGGGRRKVSFASPTQEIRFANGCEGPITAGSSCGAGGLGSARRSARGRLA